MKTPHLKFNLTSEHSPLPLFPKFSTFSSLKLIQPHLDTKLACPIKRSVGRNHNFKTAPVPAHSLCILVMFLAEITINCIRCYKGTYQQRQCTSGVHPTQYLLNYHKFIISNNLISSYDKTFMLDA